jgi:hypothetical protein
MQQSSASPWNQNPAGIAGVKPHRILITCDAIPITCDAIPRESSQALRIG